MRPMQVALAALILVAVAGVTAQPRAAVADTARSVAERVDGREMGRDARIDMVMRLIDRQGRVRERSLLLTALRDPAAPGDRLLVRFLGPNDIKGTAFLVWEHSDTEDERFLYLPALGRVRRIAGAEKQESFAGSDFSYEDIGRRRLDDYTYAFVDQNGSWTGPDGRAYPAWQIEARAVEAQARYPRTVSTIRKDHLVVVAADIYNRRNEPEKRYEVQRLQLIDGIWTAMETTMVNAAQRTRTELLVKQARYNIGLSEKDFTRRVLEERASSR